MKLYFLGISTLLVFKSSAAIMFHLVPDDTDDTSLIVDKVLDKIRAEINDIEIDRNKYYCHIDRHISQLSKQGRYQNLAKNCLDHCQLALLIGNIITSVVKKLSH